MSVVLDIVKDSSITRTIWKQELGCTEDEILLRELLNSYLCCVNEAVLEQWSYEVFYKKVLQVCGSSAILRPCMDRFNKD